MRKTAVICAQDDRSASPPLRPISPPSRRRASRSLAIRSSSIRRPPTLRRSCRRCWPRSRTSYASTPATQTIVHPLTEQAFQQGFKGTIISCTADFYKKMIDKTSKEFMEGFIFQFPDFDDPALNEPQINFRPQRVLRGVQEALRRGRVERGVVGIRLDHGSVV